MAQNDNAAKEQADYLVKLRTEFGQVDQSLSITNRLLQNEIDRVIKGGDGSKPIEIHRDNPMKLSTKLLIPIKEFPKVNFVGKLIGPGGANMKRLQHELGCRMAVYGRGSMRDKSKEEELRKEGGKKYGHLNDELHVYLEVQAPAEQAYERMGHAISAIKPYFDPVGINFEGHNSFEDGNLAGGHSEDPYSNGGPHGGPLGGPHGAPPHHPPPPSGRGGPPRGAGGGRGRGAPPAPQAAGAPRGRGGAAPRGAQRGAPRGAPPARPAPAAQQHDRYGEDDYYGAPAQAASAARSSYSYEADTSYEQDAYSRPARTDPYASRSGSEVQSFDYGHGSTADQSYEAPAQDTWERRDPYARAPAPRGRAAADHRPHPYAGERPARQPAPRY